MKRHLFEISVCLSIFIPMLLGRSPSALGQAVADTARVLNPDTIIKITYRCNPRIAAARHKLKSAQYNYKLFESEYSQFIPLIISSRVQQETSDGSGRNTSGRLTVGLQKEFFNGSFASLDVGAETERGPGSWTHSRFVEGHLEFPLFSSNRKLSRVIKRTFEENELYSANLGYVEQVREALHDAQEDYYDFISSAQILKTIRRYKKRLEALLKERWVQEHPADRQQVEDEISSLDSDIKGWEVVVASLKIRLQREIGLKSLGGFRRRGKGRCQRCRDKGPAHCDERG